MNVRLAWTALAAALLALPGCEAGVDVDVEPDRAGVPAPHPAPAADAGVWARRADVVVVDEPLAVDLELRLRADGTFRFLARVEEADGTVEREVVEGRYRWEGDRLTLVEDGGRGRQTLRLRGESLEIETAWPVDVALAVTGLPRLELRRVR